MAGGLFSYMQKKSGTKEKIWKSMNWQRDEMISRCIKNKERLSKLGISKNYRQLVYFNAAFANDSICSHLFIWL